MASDWARTRSQLTSMSISIAARKFEGDRQGIDADSGPP